MCHKLTFSSASSLLLMEMHLVDILCLFKLQLSFGLFWHGEMLKTLLSWATHRTVEMFLISSSTCECFCFVWAHGNLNFYWFFPPTDCGLFMCCDGWHLLPSMTVSRGSCQRDFQTRWISLSCLMLLSSYPKHLASLWKWKM